MGKSSGKEKRHVCAGPRVPLGCGYIDDGGMSLGRFGNGREEVMVTKIFCLLNEGGVRLVSLVGVSLLWQW